MRYIKSTQERRKHRTRMAVRHQGKPRLSVFRSGRYIYAQVIDDAQHATLASACSLEKEAHILKSKSDCKAAHWVGLQVAQRAKAKGVDCVVFDRGGYKFHGRVKALAQAAREGGLTF